MTINDVEGFAFSDGENAKFNIVEDTVERHEFKVPFTPCVIAICVSIEGEKDIDITVLLKYRRNWRIAGGVNILFPSSKSLGTRHETNNLSSQE